MSAPALTLSPIVRRPKAEAGLAAAVLGMIGLLILPLPPLVLDLFLAASIGISLIILLTVMQTEEPLEFSAFPSILLLFTLFRLALNVSSTRLILSDGEAGAVIHAFGEFVIGGNYVVGIVLFLILIGINFIVITKGAGRVAEVSARFTLDAMPGKQMAIDADLSAGLIDENDARRRRDEVSRQADFYGAMDGASKFVKGDAVAGLLITGINIVGGIIVGVAQRGLPFGRAAATYTTLTVGEGLVTQIPALIVSTATGIMVTRATGGGRMGSQVAMQLGAHPKAITFAAIVMGVFGVMPGMPRIPFIALSVALFFLARATTKAQEKRQLETAAAAEAIRQSANPPIPADPVQDLLQIDSIEIEVGYALIPLVDERQGGDLLERVQLLRKQSALEVGILVPPVRIRDDIRLQANEYVIKLRGIEIARAEVMPRLLMALDTGAVMQPIEGIETVDPSFGMSARWIPANRRLDAEACGYVVVESSTVIATHLMESVKSNAAELLGRQDVQGMLESLKKTHGALVDDLIPGRLSLATLHRVLQRLLRERVPIRDLVTILEALGDAIDHTKDVEPLTEHVRRSLMNSIARQYSNRGSISGITLGASLEATLMGLFSPRTANSTSTALTPESLGAVLSELNAIASQHATEGRMPPLIVPPSLRVGVRRLVEPILPSLPVLSLAELPPTLKLNALATWDLKHAY